MKHPLAFVPNHIRKTVFLVMLAWTLFLFAVFQVLNIPQTTSAAPFGIVSHQLAWTPEKATAIFDSWDSNARLFAAFGLGFDFLFMPFYAITLSFGTLLSAGRHPGWFARLSAWMGWAVAVAWLFDALENIGQVDQLLKGEITAAATFLVGICAVVKFSLILIPLAFSLTGWFWRKAK